VKKLYINKIGQIILKTEKIPEIEFEGSIVKTCYALISAGTELSTIKRRRFKSQSFLKQILKSQHFRERVLEFLVKASFKEIFNKIRNYVLPKKPKKNFTSPVQKLAPTGYSCSGIIQKTNINGYHQNDRIACAGSNHAEIIFAPKNLSCKIPDNVSLQEAAFTTLGSIALHSIHRADLKPGEYIGIIGTGLIGLIVLQLAKISTTKVFAIDLINKRLNIAKSLGADTILNPKIHQINDVVVNKTEGKGLDTIIICAGSASSKPLEMAVDLIRKSGKIVILGDIPIKINRRSLYHKEADILISRSYGPGRYDSNYELYGYDYPANYIPWTVKRNMEFFLKLISEGKINVKALISDIIPYEKSNLAYQKLIENPSNSLGVLINFTNGDSLLEKAVPKQSLPLTSKKLTIGLIGCGSFAQSTHIPHLITNPNCKIKAICTQHKTTAEICMKRYNPTYVTTNYRKILKDPEINTVFIYTRHNSHAKFTKEAINANKNVFVEKPMGLTMDECLDVYSLVKNSQCNYIIGFNRRFSPFIKITKELLNKRTNPIIIHYRIASNYRPEDHWLFDPKIGGGPLIGEFCHFTDLILYLINSKPVELFANGGELSHINTKTFDSCNVTIKFKNNSIANIIYTDLSGPKIPKERIEIFSGDSAIIIDDFKKMETSGFNIGNRELYLQNKGHKAEINNIINSHLNLESSIINVNDALRAMDLCFKTIESIESGKIVKLNGDLYI